MTEDDLVRVRQAVSAYFRAASALGSASLLMRHAALLVPADEEPGEGEPSDGEFLHDRAATYHQKALLMSRSAAALLSHAEEWFADLGDAEEDVDRTLGEFAAEVESAADAYAAAIEAMESASFAELATYPELIRELRDSARFLKAEAASFRALAEGELEDEGELNGEDEQALGSC